MNNIELLNSSLQLFAVLNVICLAVIAILIRKIPFIKVSNDYVNFRDLLFYVLKFLGSALIGITLTIFIYYAFGTSRINIADTKSDMVFLIFLIINAFIVSLWINMITTCVNFIYKLIFYIKLKRNTISNNLRHAIFNKDEQAIIENHKLIKQTDMIVNLSKEETIVLTACLSKHGFNEDVKQMLQPIFYKEQSLLNKFFTTNTDMVEYTVKEIDENFVPRDTFKHKIKQFNNITNITSYIMTVAFIIQFLIVTLGDGLYISNTMKMIFVILTSVLIISMILMKHRKIKEIYRKELEIANLSNSYIKIKKPILESILLGVSLLITIITFIDIFFF